MLTERTRRFAVRAVKLCRSLPATWEARRIGGQLIDSSTSVYANYRATCRSRSRREFIAKIGLVTEEADESLGWLELLVALDFDLNPELPRLVREAGELVAIFSKSQKTANKIRRTNRQSPNRQSTISEALP
jgi:four helix bundle protein